MRTRALAMAAGTALALLAGPAQTAAAAQKSTPPAQKTPPRAQRSAPFGPQNGVKGERNPTDLKTILYYAADALGMLRGAREDDLLLTMQVWGTGSMNVGGQPCKLANYLASIRYPTAARQKVPVPAMRVDFACSGANGRPGPRQIHVVADKFAWNEAKPGLNPSPEPGAVNDRLLDLWTLFPESVIKAARAAGADAKVTFEGATPVLTFSLPAPLASATMKAALNPRIFRVDANPAGVKREYSHLLERTETRFGNRVIEVTYSDYGDWNDEDLKSMVLLPRHIVAKQGGVTMLDLAITKTDTFNPYVIMPKPANVEKGVTQ
jgi:hypothetical protein